MVKHVLLLTLHKVLSDRSNVVVHTGIVRRIVRTVVLFGCKIIRARSVTNSKVKDESEENGLHFLWQREKILHEKI